MALDLEALTAPLSDDAPSGPDLCYENERAEIEKVFDRSIGVDGDGSERSAKEWNDTIKLILAEAGKTRDMWLPVYYMRAAALGGQFDRVVEGAQFLARLVEERWDDVHPQLDEYGFIGRKTPCESLVKKGDFLIPFARMPLFAHERLGKYSGEDLERFNKQGGKAEGFGMFTAFLEAASPEEIQAVSGGLDLLREAIQRIDSKLTENAEGDTGTNFQPLYEVIDGFRKALAALTRTGEAAADDQGDGAPGGPAVAAGGNYVAGAINSRDDVIRALDAIDSYYARHEPGSPVPFALRRAKDWISLDFMAVLEDIAPGSVDEATRVLKGGRSGGDQGGSWSAGSAPVSDYASDSGGDDSDSDSGW